MSAYSDDNATPTTATRPVEPLPATPTVATFMTAIPATVEADWALSDALDRMYSNNIRHLPVLDDGERLVGVLSTRDIAIAVQGDAAGLDGKTVADAMSNEPFTCAPEAALEGVVAEMERRRLGSAVVVSEARVVGMFTSIDALRALRSTLAGHLVEPLVVPRHTGADVTEGLDPILHRRGERHRRSNRSSMRWALFSY